MSKQYYIIILIIIASFVTNTLDVDYPFKPHQSALSYDILFFGLVLWLTFCVMGRGLWNKK